eukprot:CAMPEP_0174832048 /NCGR_PEP_ID=MMETSP1114-20130205/3456_1 /TAXON_ID=312471 /ORGANISM="Neobodo designis, Strain CCAP 1951/1" /LENGTH=170 /DNA_ID=CAMNT_0016065899 /DNA_START=375 /DNA_END=884 /DNA_ORIENTATION=+
MRPVRATTVAVACIAVALAATAAVASAHLDCPANVPATYPANCPNGICNKKTCNAFGAPQEQNCKKSKGKCPTATCVKFNPSCTQNCLGRTAGAPAGKLCILEDTSKKQDFRICGGGCVSCEAGTSPFDYVYPANFQGATASSGSSGSNSGSSSARRAKAQAGVRELLSN